MIFYIHGFNSCAARNRDKVRELARLLGEPVELLDYASHDLAEDIFRNLMYQIADHAATAPHFFIGSSLGGFWAERLAQAHTRPAALFNPCFQPTQFLAPFIGEIEHFCTHKRWDFTLELLDSYAPFEAVEIDAPRVVFTATNDDLIPSEKVKAHYAGVCEVVEIEGGHSVLTFAPFVDKLREMRDAWIDSVDSCSRVVG